MKTILADNCGFCFGIKRATKIAFGEKNKKNVYTLGDLLHNPQYIKKLESYGIKKANYISDIKSGTVIIRAHGVPVDIIKKAKEKKLKVLDATCPKVKKVHILAKKLSNEGYKVIIFGDKKHPEVKGIASNVKNPTIINSPKEAKNIKKSKRIGLVSQTTQQVKNFNIIKKILEKKSDDFVSLNTICDATRKRQDSAKKLAEKVDIMIVIGGKHSSNTQKLAHICKDIVDTHHIETPQEIKKSWFNGKEICGITAGASTPNWIIKNVIKKIEIL